MGVLRVKPGVAFAPIAPAGFRLLGALDRVARSLAHDLTITAGSDSHPPSDPHSLGNAYDIRTHDLTPEQKAHVLRAVLLDLHESDMDAPLEVSGGLATMYFFGWLEHPGTPNEHLHFQLRKGIPLYPPVVH